MIKIIKLLLLFIVFQFLINIVLASENCPFTVEGKKAYITNDIDECIIQTNEGDLLKINFTICDKIKFRAWSQILDNNGPPLISFQLVNFRYPSVEIQDTIAILNKDGRFITVTYIAHFDCLMGKTTTELFPKIKVYTKKEVPEPPLPSAPPKNRKPKWISNNDSFIINGPTKINLSEHFVDEDNDTLTYTYDPTNIENIIITIENEIVEINPDKSFTGNKTIVFSAWDGKDKFDKRITLIVLNKTEPQPQNILTEWINNSKSFLLKYWKIIAIILLIIIGIFYAKIKWKKRIKDSVKGMRKKAVKEFEKTIEKIGITKPKKQKPKP